MSESTAPRPTALLVHDGELGDVRALLASLDVPCTERRGSLERDDLEQDWGLVATTPQRARLLHFTGQRRPTCIAICDRDSRTLRNSLRRAGIGMMVRRPVHPAALRALVLHALYRGPERRRNARVPIGAPVSFRRMLGRRAALLADLSLGGCRLLTERPLEPGRRFALLLPAELTGGRALRLRARVLRHWKESEGAEQVMTAQFERIGSRRRAQLERALATFAEGPAVLAREAPSSPPGVAAPASTPTPRVPAAPSPPAPARPAAVAVAPARTDTLVRRAGPRAGPARPTSPLAEQAARVLLGRDISIGGMRVERDAALRPGQDVRIALHVPNLDAPLRVTARVHRDEGERGLLLRFHALSPEETRQLNALVDSLPAVEPGAEGDEAGIVVSELLEPVPAVA